MKQIVIVSEDRPDVVAEIADALAAASVNIEFLDAEVVGSSKIVVLAVDRYDVALKALAQTSLQAISEDALVIQLDDKPGQLARITQRLRDVHIDVRSIRIIRREAGKGIVAVATDRNHEARKVLADVLVSYGT
ncbi:MAG: ACT domain-containing protein [Planctomycetaceae bacterium]|nr:ACT domain-containing protein [Planctomycetaceae bacterium]